eukprot:2484209-Pyramimonas_sp.AAC.1
MQKAPSSRPDRAAWEQSAFDKSLNDWEVRNIIKYEVLNDHRPMICAVGQSADKHATHSKGKPTMMTIIRKNDMYYSSKHRRWLTPSELRTVHNYVGDSLCQWGLQTSFSFKREDFGFPPRRRVATLHQIGNGMALCTESLGFYFIWAVMAALREPGAGSASVDMTDSSSHSASSSSGIAQALAAARQQGAPKRRRLRKGTPSDVERAAAVLSELMRPGGQA